MTRPVEVHFGSFTKVVGTAVYANDWWIMRGSGVELAGGAPTWHQLAGGIRVEVLGRRAFVVLPAETGTVIYNWVEDVIEDAWRTSVYRKVVAHVACDVLPSPSLFRGRAVHFAKLLRDLA